MDEIRKFFEFIYYDAVGFGQYLTIFTLPSKESKSFKSIHEAALFCFEHLGEDVFYRVTLESGSRKRDKSRGDSDSTAATTCLWCDLDVKDGAFHSIEEAVCFAKKLPIKPSMIVCSGNGVHAYWLLNDPLQTEIEKYTKGWHGYVCSIAKDHEKKIENLGDTARILRPAGTINHKNQEGKPVYIIEQNDLRYYPQDFEHYLAEYEANESYKGEAPLFEPLPDHVLSELMKSEKFSISWNSNGQYYDASAVDESVATLMYLNGYGDDVVASALYRRRNERTPSGHDKKLGKINRASYIVPTLAKAKKWAESLKKESIVDESAIAGIMSTATIPAKKTTEPVDPDAMSQLFYDIPGVIGEMIKYHVATAPRPRPELSLAATIALVGTVTGRKIRTISNMRTNLYCIGLAPSGSGKERPRNNNVMALTDAGISGLLGSENPASDAALVEELHENPAMLIQIDEVSRYFETLKRAGGNSTHLKNIFTRILELTGCAENPAWQPKGYADKRKVKIINHPHLCIYGTSTPDGFWKSVQSSDAVDGFLARMMVIEAKRDYPRLQEVEMRPTPQLVVDILQDWHKYTPPGGGNLSSPAYVVEFESAAKDRIKSHSDAIEERLPFEPDDHKAIWSRASALAKRLSLIFAASRGPHGLKVSVEDAIAAVRLTNWCTRLLIRRVFTHVADNETDSEKKRVLEIIRRSGEISMSTLTRKTQWLKNRRYRAEILDELLEGGYIEKQSSQQPDGGGHIAHIFRAT